MARNKLPSQFDHMRDIGALSMEPKVNAARWRAGNKIRQLHAIGWQNPDALEPGTLSRAGPVFARAELDAVERALGSDLWPIVVRLVIEGALPAQCAKQIPEIPSEHTTAVTLDRLRIALDMVNRDFPGLGSEEV